MKNLLECKIFEGASVKNMNFNETYMKDLLKQWGKHVVALILFLGLVMVYFSPAVFDGKVVMQGDNIKAVGMGHSQMDHRIFPRASQLP